MPGTWKERNGSYYLEVCIGTNYKGEPQRYYKTVKCKSIKDAEKELAKFYTDCERGNVTKTDKTTLSAFCDTWLKEYAEMKVKRSTIAGYKTAIEVKIKPTIGSTIVGKLKTKQVQEWINEMTRSGLSPKTVKNYFSVLDTIMQTALKWDYTQKNPCDLIDLPPMNKKETDFLNIDEVGKLLNCLDTVPYTDLKYKVGVLLALFCGLRKGEIMGLNWDDVTKNTIKIDSTRMCVNGYGLIEDTPKSERSERVISIPEVLSLELKKLLMQTKVNRVRLGNKWIESNAVLVGDFGSPLYPQMLSRWFTQFQIDNGLRVVSLHKLRHTQASMLYHLNVDGKKISNRLGHSQLSTTLDIYTHLFENTDQEIAKQLNDFTEKLRKKQIK